LSPNGRLHKSWSDNLHRICSIKQPDSPCIQVTRAPRNGSPSAGARCRAPGRRWEATSRASRTRGRCALRDHHTARFSKERRSGASIFSCLSRRGEKYPFFEHKICGFFLVHLFVLQSHSPSTASILSLLFPHHFLFRRMRCSRRVLRNVPHHRTGRPGAVSGFDAKNTKKGAQPLFFRSQSITWYFCQYTTTPMELRCPVA